MRCIRIEFETRRGDPVVVVEKTAAIPGREENFPPQEIIVKGAVQTNVMGGVLNFSKDVNHTAQKNSTGAARVANKVQLPDKGLKLSFGTSSFR